MRMIRMRMIQTFEYLVDIKSFDYPDKVDAFDVAKDELAEFNQDPQQFVNVDKENVKVFIIPADKCEYWAFADDIANPKKWCKRYRQGMVKLTIPAIITSEYEDDEDDDQ